MGNEDTACARLGGEVADESASALAGHTLVVKTNVCPGGGSGATNCHAETLRERGLESWIVTAKHLLKLTGGKALIGCCLRLSLLRSNWV